MRKKSEKWQNALDEIWYLNRAHVGSEISLGYKKLKKFYKDINIFGYKTGSEVNGWKVSPGWDVKKAFLKEVSGKIIADWSKNKLSLWTYSPKFKGTIKKNDLLKKLFFDKKRPNRTLFHFRNQYNFWKYEWGFSLPYNKVKKLKDKNYVVDIDTKFFKSKLEMAEQVHKGSKKESILFVGHFDHPQMCLDGLVGCLAGHEAIESLKKTKTRYTYRMLSTVEIIGSVFYAKYKAKKNFVKQAAFLASSGAPKDLHYQHSFSKNNLIDVVSKHCIKYFDNNFKTSEFRKGPLGNDEVAFDVGGVNIPCGSIMRAPFETYHTDLDIPTGVSSKHFKETVELIKEIIFTIDNNCFIKRNFSGLPRLSSKKNNLYLSPSRVSGVNQKFDDEIYNKLFVNIHPKMKKYLLDNSNRFNHLMNSIPNMSNGDKTILDIAEFVGLPFRFVNNYLNLWEKKGLIKKNWKNLF
tara:strand:+ start:1086 stop:2474 length:1389 start_codon:yes stop_codon:yes gene_type:complete